MYNPPDNPLPQGNVQVADFRDGGHLKYDIKPIGDDTFWSLIKSKNIKFTLKKYPHECPIHRDGPIQLAALDVVVGKLKALQDNNLQLSDQQTREQMVLFRCLTDLLVDTRLTSYTCSSMKCAENDLMMS